jgi:hypothetical protein
MAGKTLLVLSITTLILQIFVLNLGYSGMLGSGDTCFIRFVQSGITISIVAIAIIAVILGFMRRIKYNRVIAIILPALLSVGIFLAKLLY